MTTSTTTTFVPVMLKWNKQKFALRIEIGEKVSTFMETVREATGVPAARQKLLASKRWKGQLRSDSVLEESTIGGLNALNVTLIGSAETLATKPASSTTKFVEDMSPEDLVSVERQRAQNAMADREGMIEALQLLPHHRDDRKQEVFQYNQLVSGLPQRQIEQDLKHGQKKQSSEEGEGPTIALQGKVAMQLGLELRRAYINDLAVLEDGTCVSVLDDGHVQLWKNAAQQHDVVHQGLVREGGVDSVVALRRRRGSDAPSFATAGRGSIQLWTADANPIVTLPGAISGTSPASLQCVFGGPNNVKSCGYETPMIDTTLTICLAARFEVTRQSNPSQFLLAPQNEAQRQRRADAVALERIVLEGLAKAARGIQVWFSVGLEGLSTKLLEPPTGDLEGTAPITCLATLFDSSNNSQILVAGDDRGGIRLWKAQLTNDDTIHFNHLGLVQVVTNSDNDSAVSCSVVCMEALSGGRLAVSTDTVVSTNQPALFDVAARVSVQASRGVHVFDFSGLLATPTVVSIATTGIKAITCLTGHTKDAVICMCELPDGGLLTGGGKMDATLQMWSRLQIIDQQTTSKQEDDYLVTIEDDFQNQITSIVQSEAIKTLTGDVGYVFALTVLPDSKDNSDYYAIAAARYNTIKIII